MLLTTGVGRTSGRSGRGGVGETVGDGVSDGVGETVGVALGDVVGVWVGGRVMVGMGVKVTAGVVDGNRRTNACSDMGVSDGASMAVAAISVCGAHPRSRNSRTAVLR